MERKIFQYLLFEYKYITKGYAPCTSSVTILYSISYNKQFIKYTVFCLFGKHPDGRILHHFQSRPRDRRSDCAVALTLHTKYRPPSFLFFTASHHGLESVAGHGSTEQKLVAHSVGSFFQRQRASTVAWKTSVYSGS